MNTASSFPTFTEVTHILDQTQAHYHAAQVHGLLCGFICGTSGETTTRWQHILFGQQKNPGAIDMLTRLYEISYQHMSEFSFEFTLLLPEDDANISTRTEALGLWCQGFLTGLEQSNAKLEFIPDEVAEALDDITEIAQVDYDSMTENEEDDVAYFELVEYSRLAILMIYHELKSGGPEYDQNTNENGNGNNMLH